MGRLGALTILYVDGNRLTQIPTSLPSSLIKLYMHNNRITDIKSDDLINLINLEVLDVSGNSIIYMPQLVLPTLITLSVKSCGLENVNRQISKTCPRLLHLLIDGNLIKCSSLMEVEALCSESSEALTNEYINDYIGYNQDDLERKERHLNSLSHFPNDGGWQKKCRGGGFSAKGATMRRNQTEAEPNCWNEQKLITSFNLTNDSTSTATASDDNKFQGTHNNVTKEMNEGNLSNQTMKINNNTSTKSKVQEGETPQPSGAAPVEDSKATAAEARLMKKAKLAFPVGVAKTEIKALNNNDSAAGVDKNLSLGSVDAHKQKGLNNLNLMKTKQSKASDESATSVAMTTMSPSSGRANPSNYGAHGNQTGTTINRNLIDNVVNGDYGRAKSSDKVISANKIKAIKDNEGPKSTNNNSKSHSKDSTSRDGANGAPLVGEWMARGGNGGATDHQQHISINQEQSERWNDIRGESINHPGLLIVITVSVGVLFTFIVVYVYRCNFINSARRRRRRGSCETINEGRDVLSDNFNEETRSFPIETHNHCSSPLSAMPSTVNQCDLLPMDILNATLSQSTDRPQISIHSW